MVKVKCYNCFPKDFCEEEHCSDYEKCRIRTMLGISTICTEEEKQYNTRNLKFFLGEGKEKIENFDFGR
jgi:hypothetical protein